MTPEPTFKLLWIAWILFFCVVEFIAVRREGYGDTFSEFVWWIIGSGDDQRDVWRWTARIFLAGLIAWLIPHFFTRWKWW
jgi:hypothetical protein